MLLPFLLRTPRGTAPDARRRDRAEELRRAGRYGGTEKGLLIHASKAVVASPSDGWVAFAGPYRSYGQLLIINAGDGYYIVLAGMERINVEVGQFVLAGEPVAPWATVRPRRPRL